MARRKNINELTRDWSKRMDTHFLILDSTTIRVWNETKLNSWPILAYVIHVHIRTTHHNAYQIVKIYIERRGSAVRKAGIKIHEDRGALSVHFSIRRRK